VNPVPVAAATLRRVVAHRPLLPLRLTGTPSQNGPQFDQG